MNWKKRSGKRSDNLPIPCLTGLFPAIIVSVMALNFILPLNSCSTKSNQPAAIPPDSLVVDPYSVLSEQIKKDPDNDELYFKRAKINFNKKDFNAALGDINRAMKIDFNKAEYYLFKSDIFFASGMAAKSKATLENLLLIDQDNTEACLKLAEIYLLVKQYDHSIEYINRALKKDKHLARAYFMKGLNYKYIGDTSLAISSLQTAVEQDPEYIDAFLQLGILYAAKNDSIGLLYYNNALEIDSDKIDALYDRALYLQEHGRRDAANRDYQHILRINPAFVNAYYNLGYNAMYTEQFRDAAKYFTQALSLQPDYTDALYNRGFCYEHLHEIQKALADYKACLKQKPDYTLAAKGISRITEE